MSLQQQLSELKTNIKAEISEEVLQIFDESIQALYESGMAIQAPQVGDEFNNFVLSNQLGQQISQVELRNSGPVVMVFYRDGLCPYCNLELRVHQQIVHQLKAAGDQLVAITPEWQDSSLSTIEKNEPECEILSNIGAEYTRKIDMN